MSSARREAVNHAIKFRQSEVSKPMRLPANQRTNAMRQATIALDQTEEDLLNFDVSDEALETAAGIRKEIAANPTVPSAIICIPFAD